MLEKCSATRLQPFRLEHVVRLALSLSLSLGLLLTVDTRLTCRYDGNPPPCSSCECKKLRGQLFKELTCLELL